MNEGPRPMPSIHPKVREERAKLVASGCQNIAIAIVVTALVAPLVNATLIQSFGGTAVAFVAAAVLEITAFFVLEFTVRQDVRHGGE